MEYFCIEGSLYKMTAKNYQKLCELYPYRTKEGIVVDDFDTGLDVGTHSECLDWILEHSKLAIGGVRVFHY